jgi:flavin reductase (DIM6/NTAB) family NADH-FMN oxidoreductase RutF
VAGSPIQFECVYLNTVRFPGVPPMGAVDVVFGSVVAVGTDGSLDASVTIRTAWVPRGVPRAQYWSGGAVVWDSHPVAEREEAWRKASPFLTAIGATAP